MARLPSGRKEIYLFNRYCVLERERIFSISPSRRLGDLLKSSILLTAPERYGCAKAAFFGTTPGSNVVVDTRIRATDCIHTVAQARFLFSWPLKYLALRQRYCTSFCGTPKNSVTLALPE